MKMLPLAVYAGAIAIGGVVLAADATFQAADADGDGVLTQAEVSAAMPDASEDAFKAADTDQSGTLTETEFTTAVDGGVLPKG